MSYLCYCITAPSRSLRPRGAGVLTYVGCTNNLPRRLLQHNGELVGGARATAGKGPWTAALVVKNLDRQGALRFEWRWKHPTGKRRGGRQGSGVEGRRKALRLALQHQVDAWPEYSPIVVDLELELAKGGGAAEPSTPPR